MKMKVIILSAFLFFIASCTKSVDEIPGNITTGNTSAKANSIITSASNQYVQYTILKGQQYCDKSSYQAVKYDQLSFTVKFDSTAIYQTASKENQLDINKLYGFSDNNAQHQQYSARFGWRWSNNALRLFAYIYNNGVRSSKELSTIDIGTENSCSIKVADSAYIFTLNGRSVSIPRESKTAQAEGYKLFPYFGGDEVAPHNILIMIKE